MDTMYYDFYKASYDYGYLKAKDLIEPTKVGCLTKEEYKKITGVDFPEEKPTTTPATQQ